MMGMIKPLALSFSPNITFELVSVWAPQQQSLK